MKSLCNTATSHYLSILHLVMYIFQWHSLKLSSSLLPLLCPQVHSVHVHLYPCLAKRFINNIFVDSISAQSVSSVTQSCPTLCDPMNHSNPGLPVNHKLPEFTQTDVHRGGDAIQPSHLLWSPSPLPGQPEDFKWETRCIPKG